MLEDVVAEEACELSRAFDLSAISARFYDDPFPTYQAIRTYEPVKHMKDGSYFLTRYADVLRVYRDTKTFSSDKQLEFKPKFGDSPLYVHHTTTLVFNDPPLHTRVRRLLLGALSPKAINAMAAPLEALVGRLLDKMHASGEVDLIEDFASAIPIEVIGNLLGIPPEERAPLRDWSISILSALEPAISLEVLEKGNTAVADFTAYLEDLIARRKANPGDADKDVLTRLIRGEDNSERLLGNELLQNCIFILNAGHETTTNLIGNALHALLDWPAQKRLLCESPELIATAVEEVLRYDSSNQLGNRITTAEVAFGEVVLPKSTLITLCIGAANRDPEQFANPDTFDIRRSPNRHLAFGSGAHQCAGLHLARLEGAIAIRRFIERFPTYRRSGVATRSNRARFRGLTRLPVALF
jgi:cytochrome P450